MPSFPEVQQLQGDGVSLGVQGGGGWMARARDVGMCLWAGGGSVVWGWPVGRVPEFRNGNALKW